jgi:hypothetical protein
MCSDFKRFQNTLTLDVSLINLKSTQMTYKVNDSLVRKSDYGDKVSK